MKRLMGNVNEPLPPIKAGHIYEAIEEKDRKYLIAVLWGYVTSYLSGDLTFKKTVESLCAVVNDYEELSENTMIFNAYKSELLREALEHVVTNKPLKSNTKRIDVGTPPPQLRRSIPTLIDEFINKDPTLRKLPVDSSIENQINTNVFEVIAEHFRKRGFLKTTAKLICDDYYRYRK